MGRLRNLLKPVAAQISLQSPLGYFLQAVAAVLDAGGQAGAHYLQAVRTSVQTITANQDVVMNEVRASSGIPYDTATGIATLGAGRVYRLEAFGTMQNFIGGTPSVTLEWVDADTNVALEPNVLGTWFDQSNATSIASGNAVAVILPTAGERRVKLRCTSAGGSADITANNFTVLIEQIA